MAKKSMIEKNKRRARMAASQAAKRTKLRAVVRDRARPPEERMAATMKLAQLPRNGAPSRVRNRCEVTGRPRGYYRKLRMSRIALRELGSAGVIPGFVKSSW